MLPRARTLPVFSLLLGALTADLASQTASPAALIARAAQAMGGVGALGLRNKTVEFNTVAFGVGQEETSLSPARATMTTGRIVSDFAGSRQLTTQEVRLVTGQINRQRRVTSTSMSMLENNGAMQMEGPAVAAGLGRNLSLQIERVIGAAVNRPDAATSLRPRALRGEMVDGIRLRLGADTIAVWFDRSSGLPLATETITDDDILGDRRTVTWYTRWQLAGAMWLPRQIDVEINGRLQSHTVVTAATVDQPMDDALFAIPDSMATRAPRAPATPAAITVTLASIAPGVWRAEGGSHHSLVVEQAAGLLVVEGPQSASRSKAVLDTLNSRFPNKTVSAVVMTHHHWDHSGGIRAYQARGIRVIAHRRNVDFVRGLAAARKTVAPDRLSRGAAPPPVVGVGDSLVIGRGDERVLLYPLATSHAEGLLAAWVPAAGVVFTSDVVSPAANQPLPRVGSAELVGFARALGVTPGRYAGGHGVVVDWSAVEAAAR